MDFLCLTQDQNGRQILLDHLLLRALSLRSIPILVTGEEGFSFDRFYRRGRFLGLNAATMGKMLVANSVNMYHLSDIIHCMPTWIRQGGFPVFYNFTKQYIDENVSSRVGEYLFQRDRDQLQEILEEAQVPAFFWETSWAGEKTRRGYLQRELYAQASLTLDWRAEAIHIIQNRLTENQRGMLYGSSDSGILYISGRLIQGMEGLSQIPASRRPSLLR
ncbi:MAG: hypothetical protein GW938_04780 [Leptospira sp.]|jgi:hypothetical protein|nr:hypothetical protein [Leptospira sp.]NCS95167.1 hypothetical protein [Leptospira sp.]